MVFCRGLNIQVKTLARGHGAGSAKRDYEMVRRRPSLERRLQPTIVRPSHAWPGMARHAQAEIQATGAWRAEPPAAP